MNCTVCTRRIGRYACSVEHGRGWIIGIRHIFLGNAGQICNCAGNGICAAESNDDSRKGRAMIISYVTARV